MVNDKLLTSEQAADYLAVPEFTLRNWRERRIGPNFVILGQNTDMTQGRKRATRYRLSDLDEYISSRTINAVDRPLQPRMARQITPRTLTDAEWTAIVAAVKPLEIGNRLKLTAHHRAMLDDMLTACTTGSWASRGPRTTRHRLRKGVRLDGWVLQAFDALAAFPDFPFALLVSFHVVRRIRRTSAGNYAARGLHLRSDAHGPLQGRKTNAGLAVITEASMSRERADPTRLRRPAPGWSDDAAG